MQIYIKCLDGSKKDMTIDPKDAVDKVKIMLSESSGISKEQIRLIFKGKPMNDEKVSSLLE
jgi:hypothetical protein